MNKSYNTEWPTLKGRLSHPFTSRGEGLRQMKNNGDILTPWAEKELEKYEKIKNMKILKQDEVKELAEDEVKAFVRELSKLSRQYKIIVNACGCCNSPFLTSMSNDDGRYEINIANFDGLTWKEDNNESIGT